MNQDDIKKLALRVGNEIAEERNYPLRPNPELTIDLCTRFLAAYLAEQEPVATVGMDYTGAYILHGAPDNLQQGTKLFTAPPLPDTAPQEGTTRPAAPPARETPVGAAPLPEEVQWMSEWLREDCWHDAARLLERLAAENAALTQERDDLKDDYLRRHKDAVDRWEQLAASQAREANLREALEEANALNQNWSSDADPEMLAYYSEYRAVIKMGNEALTLPADDTALRERLKEERALCAKVCNDRRRTVSNGNGISFFSHDAASVEAGFCADAILMLT